MNTRKRRLKNRRLRRRRFLRRVPWFQAWLVSMLRAPIWTIPAHDDHVLAIPSIFKKLPVTKSFSSRAPSFGRLAKSFDAATSAAAEFAVTVHPFAASISREDFSPIDPIDPDEMKERLLSILRAGIKDRSLRVKSFTPAVVADGITGTPCSFVFVDDVKPTYTPKFTIGIDLGHPHESKE